MFTVFILSKCNEPASLINTENNVFEPIANKNAENALEIHARLFNTIDRIQCHISVIQKKNLKDS